MEKSAEVKRAFTLIELLTVIAIIAILAALLFPVFASAKQQAKKAVAISNVSQMGKSLFLYAADADDHPPVYCATCICPSCPDLLVDGPQIWYTLLIPYVKQGNKGSGQWGMHLTQDLPDIFFDPNERRPAQGVDAPCLFGVFASWGINDMLVNKLGTETKPGDGIPLSFTSFSSPSSTVLLAQTVDYTCGGAYMGMALAVPAHNGYFGWSALTTVDGFYHSRSRQIDGNTPRSDWGSNIVLRMDGSTKLTPRSELVDKMTAWDK